MKKVLIVDDAQFMAKVVSDILSQKYETVCASSGPEAIELYAREKPDMVLSDLIMPNMTGLELQRVMTETFKEYIPFMFMTADEREENESRGLEAGALDYVRKPFKADVLLRRVDNVMRQVDHIRQIQGLKAIAETDPMTGLLNKTSVQKALTDLCAKAEGILLMVDLDSFKLVNDLYGHGMGDRILICFAELLRSVTRASDVTGRMGGDEFIVFCQDIRNEKLIAEKSRTINAGLLSAAKQLMGEDMNIPLGASIGAVAVPEEGTDFNELYKKADKALYSVKQNGKHGYAFFRSDEASGEGEGKQEISGTLAAARMILEERNRQKGAYELSLEQFRIVYRFVTRSMENSHSDAALVLFAFPTKTSEDIVTLFSNLLKQSLRRGDVFTQSGKAQFMVILTRLGASNNEAVVRRIVRSWTALGQEVAVSYEYETILG